MALASVLFQILFSFHVIEAASCLWSRLCVMVVLINVDVDIEIIGAELAISVLPCSFGKLRNYFRLCYMPNEFLFSVILRKNTLVRVISSVSIN